MTKFSIRDGLFRIRKEESEELSYAYHTSELQAETVTSESTKVKRNDKREVRRKRNYTKFVSTP